MVDLKTRAALIRSLEDILFEAQYAKLGDKAAARRHVATQLVDTIIEALIISKEKRQ